jgi:hypothetical protein
MSPGDWEKNLRLLRSDFAPKAADWAVRAYNGSR